MFNLSLDFLFRNTSISGRQGGGYNNHAARRPGASEKPRFQYITPPGIGPTVKKTLNTKVLWGKMAADEPTEPTGSTG